MKTTTTIAIIAGVIAVSVSTVATFANNDRDERPSVAPSIPERVERGRYLVHRVGMCIDCHSPRDAQGQFVEVKHLTGSPVGFQPTAPMPWMSVAPRIAGLPAGFSAEDTVHFLMTGERPNGRPAPLPPMPPYRLNRDDAEAITAYLSSLSAGAQ